jgi:hypothetical protein
MDLRTSLVFLPPTHPPTTPKDGKDEEAQEQEEENEKKADTTAFSSLPIQTRLLLFVQRWFLYGKRTTVGFSRGRMCNCTYRRLYLERVHNKPYRALEQTISVLPSVATVPTPSTTPRLLRTDIRTT